MPAYDNDRYIFNPIPHRRGVDAQHFSGWIMTGEAPFLVVQHQIFDADIRQRSPHHDFVIAPAGTIAVKVRLFDALGLQKGHFGMLLAEIQGNPLQNRHPGCLVKGIQA
jgi:hypothetical protein